MKEWHTKHQGLLKEKQTWEKYSKKKKHQNAFLIALETLSL